MPKFVSPPSFLVPSVLHLEGVPPAGPVADRASLDDLQLVRWLDAVAEQAGVDDLKSFFSVPAASREEAVYRQEVFRDLGAAAVRRVMGAAMQALRECELAHERASGVGASLELARYRLTAASAYVAGVRDLRNGLLASGATSRALGSLGAYLDRYLASEPFLRMANRAGHLEAALGAIRYTLRVGPGYVTVDADAPKEDYAKVVVETFARFRVGTSKDYRTAYRPASHLNGLEERILEELASQHEDLFAELASFAREYEDPVDPVMAQFGSDMHFYLAVADCRRESERLGHPWTLPEIIEDEAPMRVRDAADLALIHPRLGAMDEVVRNDIDRLPHEHLVVITGPNQAGKTTFARIWGQLHILTRMGCPVPATDAHLPFMRLVDTHFEHAEQAATQQGKLKDDLLRVHSIVERSDRGSLVILNELFASTTATDAFVLSQDTLDRLLAKGAVVVCVTFLWELAERSGATASWVGAVDPVDPRRRTYRIRRAPPEGRAHTEALAASYGLTAGSLASRLAR